MPFTHDDTNCHSIWKLEFQSWPGIVTQIRKSHAECKDKTGVKSFFIEVWLIYSILVSGVCSLVLKIDKNKIL